MNKKYLEPYEKFIKSISYKHNLDSTIELYELIKIFKSEIKVLKVYFENEKNTIIDSNNFLLFNAIVKIKKILTERESDLSGIIYLKEDLIWFKESEGKIFKIFRAKFHDVLKSMVILKIIYKHL